MDCETKDTHLKELGPGVRRPGNFVAGYSFSIEDGPAHYIPLRHKGGDNVEDAEQGMRYLRDQMRGFKGEVVGANLSYDVDWLMEYGVDFCSVTLRDIQVADPLIYELHNSYSLQAIAERLGMPGKDEDLLREAARHYDVDPKAGMWQLPGRFVGPYGEQDVRLPLRILRKQEEEIERQGLWDIFNLECAVQPVLVKMRRRGVRIDQDRLAQVEDWSLAQEAEALAKVKHHTGVSIAVGDVWKAGALAPALLAIGIDVPKSRGRGGKEQWNIDKDLLSHIDHPVADAIGWARKTNKLRTTFAASIRRHMVDGRIHCTFNQLRRTKDENDGKSVGAAYGRLSSEAPNMQQQPARDEFAAMWRSIYLPEEGAEWFANDYSQQEPRWLTHFAEKMGLPKAAEAAERYRTDPTTDNHQMMADLCGIKRKPAKEIYLGVCYGMGGAKMCGKLGLPTRWAVYFRDWDTKARYFETQVEAREHARGTDGVRGVWEVAGEEGQELIDRFNEGSPFVKKLAKLAEKRAKARGYIQTVGGRHCRFPAKADGAWDWIHKALNRLIQGSSADQTKKALVEGDRAGHFIQLQVHDEIDGSCERRKDAKDLADIMSNCIPANVPFQVDIEIGPSWGEAEAA